MRLEGSPEPSPTPPSGRSSIDKASAGGTGASSKKEDRSKAEPVEDVKEEIVKVINVIMLEIRDITHFVSMNEGLCVLLY